MNKNSLRREVVLVQGFMEEVKGEVEQKLFQKRGGFSPGFMEEVKGEVEQKQFQKRGGFSQGFMEEVKGEVEQKRSQKRGGFSQGFMEEVKGEVEQKRSQKRGGPSSVCSFTRSLTVLIVSTRRFCHGESLLESKASLPNSCCCCGDCGD